MTALAQLYALSFSLWQRSFYPKLVTFSTRVFSERQTGGGHVMKPCGHVRSSQRAFSTSRGRFHVSDLSERFLSWICFYATYCRFRFAVNAKTLVLNVSIVRFYVTSNKPIIVRTSWKKFVPAQQHILHQLSYFALRRTIYFQTSTRKKLFLATMTILFQN